MLIAGIAAVLVTVIFLLGTQVIPLFDDTCDSFSGEVDGTSCD